VLEVKQLPNLYGKARASLGTSFLDALNCMKLPGVIKLNGSLSVIAGKAVVGRSVPLHGVSVRMRVKNLHAFCEKKLIGEYRGALTIGWRYSKP